MKESGGRFRGDEAGKDDLSWGYIDIKDMQIKGGENLTAKIEFIQPDDGNKDASDNTTVVVTALIPPLKLVTASPDTVPLHCPKPNPNPGACSAGPTL